MNRPFAIYPDSFDGDTLGYWRFGETGGRLADVVNGLDLTNVGCVAGQDGYRLVRADSDKLHRTYAGAASLTKFTMECWMRDLKGYDGIWNYWCYLAWSRVPATDILWAFAAIRTDNPALTHFRVYYEVGNIIISDFTWAGLAVDALLRSSDPIHAAVVLDSTAPRLSLYVNGIKRAEDTVNPVATTAGDTTLLIGTVNLAWPGYDLGGVLDEVRVSETDRYDANFPITRFGEGRRALARGPGLEGIQAGIAA